MSTTPPQFLFREAGLSDTDGPFIISAFDAALPYLESIGSHEQWGSTPFSQREGWVEETLQQITDSERYRLTGESRDEGGRLRIFIVERENPAEGVDNQHVSSRTVDGRRFLSVGLAFVYENWIPSYITAQSHLHIGDAERESSIYLEVVVTDSRVGDLCRGAGAALLRGVRDFGKKIGTKVLLLDGWAGNDRKLIRSVCSCSTWRVAPAMLCKI